MELIVPDDKLSLAIGKKGQNVRLASQLTGWRIDIHSRVEDLRARAPREGADRRGDRRRGLRRQRRRDAVQARLALGRRARRARTSRSSRACPASAAPTARKQIIDGAKAYMQSGGRRQDDVAQGSRAPQRSCRATSSCWSSTASTRTCSASSTRRTSTRPRTSSRRRSSTIATDDRHRHGRSRAAPPARDQLAVGGLVLIDARPHRRSAPASGAGPSRPQRDARARRMRSVARPGRRRARRVRPRDAGASRLQRAAGSQRRCDARSLPRRFAAVVRRSVTDRRRSADYRAKTPLASMRAKAVETPRWPSGHAAGGSEG